MVTPRNSVVTNLHSEIRHFRLFQMPCCKRQLDWIDGRLPNFCPECGAAVLPTLTLQGNTIFDDPEARLAVSSRVTY